MCITGARVSAELSISRCSYCGGGLPWTHHSGGHEKQQRCGVVVHTTAPTRHSTSYHQQHYLGSRCSVPNNSQFIDAHGTHSAELYRDRTETYISDFLKGHTFFIIGPIISLNSVVVFTNMHHFSLSFSYYFDPSKCNMGMIAEIIHNESDGT